MSCLLVEDEPLAAGVLEDYIRQVPWLRFVGRCVDAHEAHEALQQQAVDVMFLDIHLPGLKGLDFLRSLPQAPQTILTTAYHQYALDGYELHVVDYLLKPIDFERFLKAVQRLKLPALDVRRNVIPAPISRNNIPAYAAQKWNPSTLETALPEPAFRFFNINKKMVRVWLDDIAVVESLKEYVRLHLCDGSSLVTKGQLSDLEELLAGRYHVRAHRSFLIGLRHVEAFTATEIFVAGRAVPIGRQYKEALQAALEQYQ